MLIAFKGAPRQSVNTRNGSMALLAVGLLAFSASASEAASRKGWRDAHASAGTARTFSAMASYYGNEAGNKTASGQRFNQHAMTAAHRSLPFGTRVRVTHRDRSVVVTINDRGPFVRGRVLDLTTGAARALGFRGLGKVTAEVL